MTNAWTICISIASIIVATVVPLTIAALHRKQMRQIEQHRENPSVPLIPPPSPATRFFQRNGFFIISLIVEVAILIWLLLRTGPITRGDIFNIALTTAALAYILIMRSITQTSEQIYDYILKIYDLINKVLGVINVQTQTIDAHTKMIDTHTDMVEKIIETKKPT
jgi:uncharacterized membrane protein